MSIQRWPASWWARVPPLVQDAVMVAALLVYGAENLVDYARRLSVPDGKWVGSLLALQVAPLLLRRHFPGPVVAVVSIATAAGLGGRLTTAGVLGLLLAVYSVGAYAGRRSQLAGAALLAGLVAYGLASWFAIELVRIPTILTVSLAMAVAGLIGDHMRARRASMAELEARAERLERDRELELELAADRERTRIARELHDVVAHHVSVIAIQAGAARAVRAKDPARAAGTLDTIEDAARQALTELNRLLGLLRKDGAAPRQPEPGLDQLDDGTPRPLPSGVELSAYRIVQEGITNAFKHAPGARVEIRLTYAADELGIQVTNDGEHRPAAARSGHGLTGMRERVAVFGGQLQAGPMPEGGFRIQARLPLES
jgi:signal transduction histidine kinase